MRFATNEGMRTIEPTRWDDYALAFLLLLIGLPRVILAALYDRPLGVEGTLSIICVVLVAVQPALDHGHSRCSRIDANWSLP
jgi:hypothetical protein